MPVSDYGNICLVQMIKVNAILSDHDQDITAASNQKTTRRQYDHISYINLEFFLANFVITELNLL